MSAPATVVEEAERLAADIAKVALERERGELAAPLQELVARERREDAVVVVVGEAKRGKSSLVNALIGPVELSPVAPQVATSCHIVLRHGTRDAVTVERRDGTSEAIGAEEIPRWATEDGPHSDRARGVVVQTDSPLLAQGLALVDTPGVGGLVAGHVEITKAALAQADALLFVLDAESEIGASEIAFLEQVTQRVATVIIAFNKIDDYPDYQGLLDRTRDLLPARFRECPIVSVSSVRRQDARAAAAAGDVDFAAALLELSGFEALEAALLELVVGRREQLAALNLATACSTALEELMRLDRVRSQNAVPDAELAAAHNRARAEHAEFKQAIERWSRDVARDLDDLKLEISAQFERRTTDLVRSYQALIAQWEDGLEDRLPALLQTELDALAGSMHALLYEGLAEIDEAVTARFDLEEAESAAAVDALTTDIQLPAMAPVRERAGAEASKLRHGQMMAVGGGMGARLMTFGAAPAAGLAGVGVGVATGGLAVIGVAAGLALSRVMLRKMEVGSDRERAQAAAERYLSHANAESRNQIWTPLNRQMIGLQRWLQDDVERRVRLRGARLEAETAERHKAAQQDLGARTQQKKAADARLKQLAPLSMRLASLADGLQDA